jgi:phage terminase large subunit
LNPIDLGKFIVPKFAPLITDEKRYLILYGGAGSGKSVFASQKVVLRCMASRHRILVVRRVARTLRRSVFTEIKARLVDWGLYNTAKINTSEMHITFPNGSEIIFAGVDDVEKLKSISGITSIWIEEATELSEEDLTQLDLRLRGETPHYKQIIISFNPISHMHWLKKRFFDNPAADMVTVNKSTFRDNPYADDQYKQLFEDMKTRSPTLYQVYAEGEWGVVKGLIFKPPITLEAFPERFDLDAYGMDFGFNNPSAIVHVGLHDIDWTRRVGNVYVREVLYETGLSNTELGDRMRAIGIKPRTPIYADSAEPARIRELARQGFNVIPSVKGKGSLNTSISLLQSMTIYTLATNVNFNAEMMTYCWEEDRDGNTTDKPLNLNDHAIAGLRYAVWSTLKKRVRRIEVS